MIGRLNHVAMVVPELKAAVETYRTALGAEVSPVQELPEHGVRIVFIDLGNSKVELMEPIDATSPVAGFLEGNPNGGMHHICYEVQDLIAAEAQLREQGARVLGEIKIGAHGKPVLFLHPKDFNGCLIELEEI